jgi:hypothetical protein
MMHIPRPFVVSLALLSLPTVAHTQAAPANQPDWLSQAKIVAQMEGTSVGEAVRRARLQQVAAEQAARFGADPEFAGSWIDRSGGGFKVVFAFRGEKRKDIADAELAGASAFQSARYTIGEFKSEIARLGKALKDQNIDAVFNVDAARNKVTLLSAQAAKIRQLMTNGQLNVPDFMDVQEAAGPLRRADALVEGGGPTYGEFVDPSTGQNTANLCTAAFTVYSGSSRGISTAGHCNETSGRTQTHRSLPIGSLMATRVYAGGLDVAWFRNTSNTYTNRVRWTSTSYYTITAIGADPYSLPKGTSICVIKRDETQACGYSLATVSYGTDGPYVGMDRNIAVNSDSGAPWLYGGVAYGIHSGDYLYASPSTYYDLFTPASSLPNMGISVLTTP